MTDLNRDQDCSQAKTQSPSQSSIHNKRWLQLMQESREEAEVQIRALSEVYHNRRNTCEEGDFSPLILASVIKSSLRFPPINWGFIVLFDRDRTSGETGGWHGIIQVLHLLLLRTDLKLNQGSIWCIGSRLEWNISRHEALWVKRMPLSYNPVTLPRPGAWYRRYMIMVWYRCGRSCHCQR